MTKCNQQTLLAMCFKKNELNRKRRRFYYLWSYLAGHSYRADQNEVRKHKSFTIRSALAGYKQAQKDMKAMTAEMRQMRVELNAKFVWNDNGMIDRVEFSNWTVSNKSFVKFYQAEMFESVVLGGGGWN